MRELLAIPDESLRVAGVTSVAASANRFVERAEAIRADEDSREIRRRAYIANLMLNFYEDVIAVLSEIGKTKDDLSRLGPERLTTFIDHCPILRIETDLAMLRDSHMDRAIEANDSRDISHIQLALPYCDALVTEKFWREMCLRAGFDKLYPCKVFTDVRQMLPGLVMCSQGNARTAAAKTV